MFTNQQRREKLRGLPEEIQDLYGSLDITHTLIELAHKYQIEDKKDVLIDTVGDIMLGFHPKSNLSALLQREIGVPEAIASQIDIELKELLAPINNVSPVVPPVSAPLATTSPTPEEKPITTPVPATPKTELQNAVSGFVEPPIRPVAPSGTRTMSGDINSIQKGNTTIVPPTPLGTVPRYAKPLTDIPRYDIPKQ